jgi:glycosyltransferase involved in cell wall biosynthesis
MDNSRFEIAFLLDANITTDMLAQIEVLVRTIGHSPQLRARLIVFGPLDADSALSRRHETLCSCLGSASPQKQFFYLPSRQSIRPFDTLSLARSKALAGCDLLHCFSLSLLDSLVSVPVARLLPPCYLTLSSWPGDRNVRRLVRRAASFAAIICFTDDLRDALIAAGFPYPACMVIPPEFPVPQQPLDKSAARRLLDLPPDLDLILADSHISSCSHQQQLSWAMAVVGQFRSRIRVIFPGRDTRLARLTHLDATLTPPFLGIFTDQKYEPDLLYAAADLLALPATGPVSPLPLARAARAHLPVVASDTPFFRRYLAHERNALLFSPSAYSAGSWTSRRIRPLASAIARLFEDRDLANRLAGRLAQDINSSFLPGGSLPAHLALYQNILGLCPSAKI